MNKIAIVSKTCPDYLNNVIEMLDKYDNLKVNGLNACELAEIEQNNPEIFSKIKEKVIDGRWYPAAGLWKKTEGRISNEMLIREILYSTDWLSSKFEMQFRTFVGTDICSKSFSHIVYSGPFDCAVLDNETENYWLDGFDRSRLFIMGNMDKTDIENIDESDIKDTVFETYDEMLHNTLSSPLDIKSVKLEITEDVVTDAEKAVINAEKATAQNGIDNSEALRDCWIDIFDGNFKKALEKAEEISDSEDVCDMVKINNTDVKVNVFKFAEDKSGDIIIRIEETAGTEKNISVMCDEINAGFRCEIEPYEIATYKVDSEGFVKERFVRE